MKHGIVWWFVVLCVIAWAKGNPAQVSADVHMALGAGVSLVNAVANAAGSAVSGVSSGSGPAPVAPVLVPAVPAPTTTP
jgi:hypothetical protein